jgi:predicted outer membrane repeat protein
MKPYLLLVIGILFSACKKDSDKENPFTLPAAVCEAPETYDMTGAKNWGTGTPQSCTQESLQNLINEGGKIICNGGNQPFTITLSGSIVIPNKEVIIDGNGILTINGNNTYRIFDKQPAANQAAGTLFAIQNINLINGKASLHNDERGGAAIYGRAYGSITAINVNFENNTGPLSASDDCGAVHTIVYKKVLFANCNFRTNQGANGGAVGTIGSAMSFINCRFENNRATGTGGTFSKGGSGGAIYVDGTNQNGSENNFINICGCVFENNSSGYQAGSVNIIFYEGKGSYATIDRCTFNNSVCDADKGGACYLMNGDFSISNSTFSNNSSPVQGGGIWMTQANLLLSNCTFYKNFAVNGANGLGGAVCVGSQTTTINNCTFAYNRAGNFASAIFNGGNMSLTNNLFYKNYVGNGFQSNPYGGAVLNKETAITVNGGNMQFPTDFTGQYGTMQDYWITSGVLTTDALLEDLADNGGPTKTMALPENSPALNNGITAGAPLTDQRGMARVGAPDIGAYEKQN